jgi:uncharacterized metal-binding protein
VPDDREVARLLRRLEEFGWAWMGFETTGLAEAVEEAAAARGIETAWERIDDVGCVINRVGSIDAETLQLSIVRRND